MLLAPLGILGLLALATNSEDLENGTNTELVKAYFPLVAAVVIISLLHVQAVKGWGLNLSLLMLGSL